MIDISAILITLGTGVLRSIGGWLENALEDGKVEAYEWSQLFSTIVRVALISLGLQLGVGLDPIAASASAFVGDFVLKALKSKGKK